MNPGPPGANEEQSTQVGNISSQHRALTAAHEVAKDLGSESLLRSTGPFAELQSADRKGILDEIRRTLIAKKGRGVVFEAQTVVQIQEAAERFDLQLVARLSAQSNNPTTDITVWFNNEELFLQLKSGSDRYIKAAIKAKADGTFLLVPGDVADQQWAGATSAKLSFDGIEIGTPSNKVLLDHTERCLNRMGRGQAVVDSSDIAKRSFCNAIIDGVIGVIVDVSIQKLMNPDKPIDWARTTKCLIRTGATSALASFMAGVNTTTTMNIATRGLDASKAFRAARIAGCIAPYVLDTAIDLKKLCENEISSEAFLKNASGNVGAATAGYLLFPFVARLAVACGPLGIFVIIAGGAVVAKCGDSAGRKLFDVFAKVPSFLASIAPAALVAGVSVERRLTGTIAKIDTTIRKEVKRRERMRTNRRCEEPACGRSHHARGMCSRHYQRWWRRERRYSLSLYGVR